jgi:plasmid stabilization system protein ParE
MSAPFRLTLQAIEDLDGIWWFIAEKNQDAADRVEAEILAACRRLAKHPLMGNRRQDITARPVRFWTVAKYPDYVIVYDPGTTPLRVVAVMHGRRDLVRALEGRL